MIVSSASDPRAIEQLQALLADPDIRRRCRKVAEERFDWCASVGSAIARSTPPR